MRYRLVIAATIVAAVLLLVLVFGPRLFEIGHPRTEASPTIGVLLPVTGPVASIGKPALQGVKLAIDEVNKDRSSADRVQLRVEDTQAKADVAITAYQKLASGHPLAIVGPLTSGESTALLPWLPQHGVAIVSPGASTASLDNKKDLFFRVELSDSVGGQRQAELAYKSLQSRKIAILFISNEYGQGLATVFRRSFLAQGGSVVESIPFPPDATDFRPVLTRLRSTEADTLLLIGIDELVNIIQQAHELGVTQKLFTTPIFENEAYLQKLGNAAEGVSYVYYGAFDLNSQDRVVRDFIDAYQKAYGEAPTYYSALGYDAAKAITAAIAAAGANRTPARVAEVLASGIRINGVTGDSTLNNFGDVEKPVTLKKVVGGRFVFVEMLSPAAGRPAQ